MNAYTLTDEEVIPIDINWNAIRAEYIGGGISQRKLAEKYGVAYSTLSNRATNERWNEKREQAKAEIDAKLGQRIAEAQANNASLAADIKRSLLMRLKRIEEKYPLDATEVRTKVGNSTAIYKIKDLASAYKDLTDDMPKDTEVEDLNPLVELLR